MLLGLFAFVFDTAGGVLFAKAAQRVPEKEGQPDDRCAGISAFPMSARVVQRMAKARIRPTSS
jgi:oxaloacetate decarboxylase beta subunit